MSPPRVYHERFGFGVPVESRHNRFEYLIRFDEGPMRWVRADTLKLASEVDAAEIAAKAEEAGRTSQDGEVPAAPARRRRPMKRRAVRADAAPAPVRGRRPIPSPKMHADEAIVVSPPSDDERFRARRMIEALRLGIVPRDCAWDFTFGREEETAVITDWLAGSEGVLLLEGAYGVGKTHLLDFTYGTALNGGYAVARVQVNPNETPFSKPKRIYGQLVAGLKYVDPSDGSTGDFAKLMRTIVERGGLKNHEFFSHLADEDDPALWEWIAGREPSAYPYNKYASPPYNWYLPGMYDYGTAANIYTYLLSGISRGACDALGLKGLLLLFDESESIAQYIYQYEVQKSHSFVQALTLTANDDPVLREFPNRGTDLDYCKVGRSLHRFIYRVPTHLKIVFAMTPHTGPLWLRDESGVRSLTLAPLEEVPCERICHGVVGLYRAAYGDDVTAKVAAGEVLDAVDGFQTRGFVKGCVEALDLARNGHRHG